MNFYYEENLQENPFFVKIMESHSSLINEVGNSDWIILVPKKAQITKECCVDHEFLLSHVLVASDEMPKTHFTNLIGVDITIIDKYLRIKDGSNRQSLILFEEMFYTKDMQKFKILCIETPVCQKFLQKCTNSVNLVSNVAESIALITQSSSAKGMRKIDNAISNFTLRIQKASDYEKLKTNVKLLYDYCINIICHKKIKNLDPFLSMNLKVAVEYYLMDAVYEKLFDAISTHHSEDNQKFNKILRKLSHITFDDLNIAPTKITENLNVMRMELAKISGCKGALDKLYCIKNAIDAISTSCDDKLMATDELLPTLVFAIIKTSFFNWIPTLVFIKEFNLSQLLSPENQSAGSVMFYILTTLEAVIFFIETNENLEMKGQQLLAVKKVDEITTQEDFLQHLFQYVKDDNEIQLMQLINVKFTSFISKSPSESSEDSSLCHPLCTCSSCKFIVEESDSNVNLKAGNDLTMIHVAAAYNVPKMVTILMNLNADVDAKDLNGWTALHFAAHRGHQKVLFLLLHGKSTINSVTNLHQTPLLLAAMNGHDCCVKAMLYFADHTCLSLDLNAQDFEGNTALHYASQAGFESIVDSLLEYQARASVKNNLGKIPADYAFTTVIKNKLESALKYQAEELPVNELDYVFISNEDLADDVC
jgi:ankyrin repeat domain-containing protein 27